MPRPNAAENEVRSMNLSGVSQEEFERMQRVIDVDKWLASESAGHDLCGTMPWCGCCVKAETYPCAKARFRRQWEEALRDAQQAETAAADAVAEQRASEQPDDSVREILSEEVREEEDAETLAVPEGYEYVTRYRRSFESKIIQNATVQDFYTEIKNAILSFGGVKSRLCVGSENFRVGREKIAKLAVGGKTLLLYLALDPKKLEDSDYRFEDMSDKRSHAATPLRVRLTSHRAVRRAKELLEILAHKFELSSVGCIYSDFHFDYRSDEYLIGKGLIKPYRALVRKKTSD